MEQGPPGSCLVRLYGWAATVLTLDLFCLCHKFHSHIAGLALQSIPGYPLLHPCLPFFSWNTVFMAPSTFLPYIVGLHKYINTLHIPNVPIHVYYASSKAAPFIWILPFVFPTSSTTITDILNKKQCMYKNPNSKLLRYISIHLHIFKMFIRMGP